MILRKLFPFTLATCLLLVFSAVVVAQNFETRERQVAKYKPTNAPLPLPEEPIIVSEAAPEEIRAIELAPNAAASLKFEHLISSAIDQKLGARYRWGSSGPSAFDCSGFVWSTFQSAGINFERASARTLWTRFAPAAPEDNFKFGTLVFFSGLKHIGIVADQNGFYHASRRHGVIYSPFSEYWLSRVDGFRRVPVVAPVEPAVD
ncbi:MAG TPA: C40 family peptidase [Pyrinomonadaceae bacterium]|nr:C40 family peptidase [Pyrinomonadaceae bacterium]